MKIVNKSNIPDALFRYLSQDNYDYDKKGDSLSVTEILNPTQMVVLNRRYFSVITVDAIDQLWKLLGSGVHAILEKEKGIERIERLSVKVGGRTVSGKWDRIFENQITDYKVTSAWGVAYGSHKEDWNKQLSCYRWLYFKVKGKLLGAIGYIVALLRDWAERDKGKKNYPQSPAVEIPLELMSIEETEKFVAGRVLEITEAEKLPDGKLPVCTDKERWWNETKKTYLRCGKYCTASTFCLQLKKEKEAVNAESAEELEVEKEFDGIIGGWDGNHRPNRS